MLNASLLLGHPPTRVGLLPFNRRCHEEWDFGLGNDIEYPINGLVSYIFMSLSGLSGLVNVIKPGYMTLET